MNQRRGKSFIKVGSVLFLTLCVSAYITDASKCETCKDLTRRFKEGIEKTSNSNFGGGNTNWEERKLGSFTFSETRLIEILEYSCQDGTKECHHMLEENEELLERWWFNSYAKGQDEDLNEFLCQSTLKVCCPEGTYGPDCTECPPGKDRPCSGHGRCEGSGTREGKGSCSCDAGYQGDFCNECNTSRYFEEVKNETHTICTACHFSCQTSCHGAGAAMCDDCISRWSFVEGQGCIDCDPSCDGCTGSGAQNCIKCREKYFHDGTECKACHKSCATSCLDESSNSCDECAKGWQQSEEEGEEGSSCHDIDECSDGSNDCAGDTYCQNKEGSFSCLKCDRTCEGCTGPSNKDCKICRVGYTKSEENDCQDVDECHMTEGVCSGPNERCINTLGSYKCECNDGFVRRNRKCEAKRKGEAKKKKKKTKDNLSSENKLPEITPENLAEEIKKLGEPLKGVPIEDNEEEMVMMGGNFEKPKGDSSDSESRHDLDSGHTNKNHDDL